ncbi:branched-chain amino acid ABC transporter ATP-binding protein/permease [cf. Phormidesmis sp. LEGE 11477]|uniref:branched-chain amino acid ABC transporter ATP-binding protein/permease n=1 Tax=cf. Phormidesmis sp. LEGE 11477 TaxID=1828680 RepID=UPI001881538A|nr:branched-chain amino acid ABC transporter ATP-binding protein/permease [cf. Phormidesmis sp. LEGE 11477]MBE9059665.1 ATP-binding cassette domain-containing protein [cf. Phormidesmis sp. LEGE 11477]
MKGRLIGGLIVFALAIAATLIAPNTYYLFVLGMVAVTTIVSVGLNILAGLSGQISIGHAGFFAIGAYTGSLLMLRAEWHFGLAAVMAAIAAAGMGVALSGPALQVSGPYLAMVTIAFGIIVERVLIEWVGLTGGFGGLSGIPNPTFLGLQPALRESVLLAIVLAFLSVVSFALLKRHAWGKAFRAVRDDAIAAAAVGLNPFYVKVMAFALSAALTGLAGVFFAVVIGFVSPDSFTFNRSVLFLLAVILGGLGTAEGAFIGACILVILPEFLHDFTDYQLLVFGLLLLLALRLAPDGIASLFSRWSAPAPAVRPLAVPPDLPSFVAENKQRSPLVINNVGIQFGGIKAVDGVSLTVQPGTIAAVIGPNGAGKTTLLNLISGFYRPRSGSIQLDKYSLNRLSSRQITDLGISRTFQATRLFNTLSVLDNLRVALVGKRLGLVLKALLGIGIAAEPEPALLEVLSFVGYRGDVHTVAANLPFVDRRLVEIARALVTRPQILLLDEPAAGLSKEDKRLLAKLIRRIASSGLKVILIEHDMELVMEISDQVLVMDSGKAIALGSPTQVKQDPKVLAAYLGVSSAEAELSRETIAAQASVLSVEKLTTGYDTLQVLSDLSLTVNQGELVTVIGANGAGKSTLLKSLVNSLPIWSGEVTFLGQPLLTIPAHKMAASGLVLVPEGRQVIKELDVIDNLRLGGFHRQDAHIDKDLEQMLDRFPRLRERRRQKAGLLSGGEQQMLAIARGLMAKPRLLLLDEPSLGLAPQLVSSLYATLASLRDEGMTILLVDQMAALALEIADRAYLLETGQIVRSGDARDWRNDPEISQVYLGGSVSQ